MNLCKDLSFTVTEKAPTYDFSVIVPISNYRGLIDKAPYLKMYLSLAIFGVNDKLCTNYSSFGHPKINTDRYLYL